MLVPCARRTGPSCRPTRQKRTACILGHPAEGTSGREIELAARGGSIFPPARKCPKHDLGANGRQCQRQSVFCIPSQEADAKHTWQNRRSRLFAIAQILLGASSNPLFQIVPCRKLSYSYPRTCGDLQAICTE